MAHVAKRHLNGASLTVNERGGRGVWGWMGVKASIFGCRRQWEGHHSKHVGFRFDALFNTIPLEEIAFAI